MKFMKLSMIFTLVLSAFIVTGSSNVSAAENIYTNSDFDSKLVVIDDTDTWYANETKKHDTLNTYWNNIVNSQPNTYVVDTSSKTVSLNDASALVWWAKQVNQGNSFLGYTVEITNNIDLSEHYWTPICTGKVTIQEGKYSIAGNNTLQDVVIDGNGYKISGLTTQTGVRGPNQGSQPGDGSNCYYDSAFIGYNSCDLTIQNLTFDKASIAISEPFNEVTTQYGSSMIAVVVGAQSGGNLTLNSVSVDHANVLAMQKASAFVGNLLGNDSKLNIEKCSILNSTFSAYFMVAPIVSYGSTEQININGIRLSNNTVQVVEQESEQYLVDNDNMAEYWSYNGNYDLNASLTTVLYDGGNSVGSGTALDFVAKYGDYYYLSLSDAVQAVDDSESKTGTITLLKDTSEKVLKIDGKQKITLDLNGKKLNFPTDNNENGMLIENSASLTLIDSQGNGSIEGKWPIYVRNDATFTMNSGTINAKWYGITGNGSSNLQGEKGTTININGGVINQNDPNDPHTAAIYHPQKGVLNINGGKITGSVGIQLCSGKLSVNSGIITGTDIDTFGTKNESDGGVGDGAGISVLNRNYPGGAPYVTINGGTIISEQSQSILAYSVSNNSGTYVRNEWANAKEHVSIAGGTFSSDVTTYVAEGYKTYLVDKNYKVVPETTGIELSDKNINIAKGNAVTLTATLKPEGAIDEITWSSSDDTVATVDANGKVTAIGAGKAKITAKAGNQTATCEVTVYEVESDVEAPFIDTSKPVDEVTVGINDKESQQNISDTMTSIVDDITNGKEVTSVSDETVKNIKEAIDNGQVISTEVQVTPVKETEVNAQDKKVLEGHIDENVNIAQYLDINILVKADDQVIGEVNELDKEVTFTVAIPEDLMKEGRTFYVIRVHDGKAEKLETVENEDGTLTFKTDKFSTYALAYEDAQESITTPITPVQPAQPGQSQDDIKGETVVTPDNNQQVTNTQNTQETTKEPKTGDTSNIALYGAMALISLGLVGAIVLKKKVSEK